MRSRGRRGVRHRFELGRIVTKTGDRGETGLPGGRRVSKAHPRVEAGGDVDELNCVLGIARIHLRGRLKTLIAGIQGDLFDAGADLAVRGGVRVGNDRIAALEEAIRTHGGRRTVRPGFVLPGGTPAAALCHFARAVCRRAERRAVAAGRGVNPEAVRYLNRLSDLLYVLARSLAAGREILWNPRRRPSPKPTS